MQEFGIFMVWYFFAIAAVTFFMQASRYVNRRDRGTATGEQRRWIIATGVVAVILLVVALLVSFL